MNNPTPPVKSPTFTESHGTIILRDGLPVAITSGVLEWFHRNTNQSIDWETRHGGYALFESDGTIASESVARGYATYLTIATRRGYGIDGYVVRTINEFQALVEPRKPDYTRDYVFTHVARAQLDALEHGLNYLTGALANIAGELSTWIQQQRDIYGVGD